MEKWYTINLASYADKIADGKFCNDRSVASGYTWGADENTFYYAGKDRLANNPNPTLSCANNGDLLIAKIALIMADEIVFAGAKNNTDNTNYYLYNGQNYWTLTPFFCMGGIPGIYSINANGQLKGSGIYTTEYGFRPVINIRTDIIISSGNGTISTPYIIS